MYTLEKHLEESCKENPQYEILNSIWKLNKKQLPLAQSAISFNFPHYSLHENSHSNTIVRNIESFLGEERIIKLSPTDTWMILMSAHTHDLGMIIFHSALEEKWIEDSFQEYLIELSEKSNDKDLRSSATLLLEIENQKLMDERDKIKLPLEIRKAVILVVADFFRKSHHVRSKEMISGKDKKFYDYLNGFNLRGIPNRFSNVLSEIAFSHGSDFYSIFERLEFQSDGFGSDKMHSRFIAFMLRLGDLLDIDDKRFNVFDSQVLSSDLPHTSQLHKDKHASTKHLLISPESIEATVDCGSDEVYRIAREWFDWLQTEVESQSREWASIAPKTLQGMPPTISKGKLKVLYNSAEPKKELMNLRFAISNKKVFEMFEGAAIYEKAEFVFLRELVQNAIDASKIQLWKFINAGVYDYLIRKERGLPSNIQHDEIVRSIRFPQDLPKEIYESFQINLNIDWADKEMNNLKVEILDNGTGISERDLIRMTQKVGESRSQDTEYRKFKNLMPYWMKPTGAFGIGLQSVFLLVPSFTVQTKTENEDGREIIFQSAKKGEYSKVTRNKVDILRGTKVTIIVPKEKFSEIFTEGFSITIIDNYDYFTDKFGDIYMHKMREYIEKELKYVNLLNVNMFGVSILSSSIKKENNGNFVFPKPINEKRENDLICTLYERYADHPHSIVFHENISIGSEIELLFYNSFQKEDNNGLSLYSYPNNKNYYVRDIPVDEKVPNFYLSSYFKISWNLQSPESDKILNISRDKLIKKNKYKLEDDFLVKILPRTISAAISVFEQEYSGKVNSQINLATEYFHIELTASMFELNLNSIKNIYADFSLPIKLVVEFDLSAVSFKNFFGHTKVFILSKKYNDPNEQKNEDLSEVWRRLDKSGLGDSGLVVLDERYLLNYFRKSSYFIKSYNLFQEENGIVQLKVLEKLENSIIEVKVNEFARKSMLSRTAFRNYSKRRPNLFPIEPYFEVLSVDDIWYDGFGDKIDYSKAAIISPFNSSAQFEEVSQQLSDLIKKEDKVALKAIVNKTYLPSMVPDRLVEWILAKSSSGKKSELTRDMIFESYLDLVVEMLIANK